MRTSIGIVGGHKPGVTVLLYIAFVLSVYSAVNIEEGMVIWRSLTKRMNSIGPKILS